MVTKGYFNLAREKKRELLTLGVMLKENRGNLTQKQYSEQLGCGISTLQKCEKGIYFGRLYVQILKNSNLPIPQWIRQS